MEEVEKIIDKGINSLNLNVENFNQKILKQLENLLSDYTVKGELQFTEQQSAELREKIKEAFKEAGWGEMIDKHLLIYDVIKTEMLKEYRIKELMGERITYQQNEAFKLLKGSYFIDDVVVQLEDSIRQGMFSNRKASDQRKIFANLLLEKGIVTKYVSTIATDAINQFAGAINEEIRIKFKPTKFTYVGSVIETSRPFCQKYHGKTLTLKELEDALNEFIPNGIPSDAATYVERTNDKGEKVMYKTTKGAGMIEGTTVNNFATYVGGYNCRHIVRWDLRSIER